MSSQSPQQPEEQRALRTHSDRLIEELEAIKALELEKRGHEISSPGFHELADAIAEKSREIFRLAAEERFVGNEVEEPQGVAVEDVDPGR